MRDNQLLTQTADNQTAGKDTITGGFGELKGNSISKSSMDILKNYSARDTNIAGLKSAASMGPAGESAGTKNTEIEMNFNAFIPNDQYHAWFEDNMAWLYEPMSGSTVFASDNRTYNQEGTSRIAHKAKMTFDPNGKMISKKFEPIVIGASHQADVIKETTGYTPLHPTKDWIGGRPIKKVTGIANKKTETAPNKGDNTYTQESWGHNFNMRGEASYPFSSMAPDIDFNVNYLVMTKKVGDKNVVGVGLWGVRNNFPAYEGFIRVNGVRKSIYNHTVAKSAGPGLFNLNTSTIFNGGTDLTVL